MGSTLEKLTDTNGVAENNVGIKNRTKLQDTKNVATYQPPTRFTKAELDILFSVHQKLCIYKANDEIHFDHDLEISSIDQEPVDIHPQAQERSVPYTFLSALAISSMDTVHDQNKKNKIESYHEMMDNENINESYNDTASHKIQNLLQQAKQRSFLDQRMESYGRHVQDVEKFILPANFGNDLLSLTGFQKYWTMLSDSLSSDQQFVFLLSKWFGTQEINKQAEKHNHDDLLDIIIDIVVYRTVKHQSPYLHNIAKKRWECMLSKTKTYTAGKLEEYIETQVEPETTMVNAYEVIDCLYRLAVAVHVLHRCTLEPIDTIDSIVEWRRLEVCDSLVRTLFHDAKMENAEETQTNKPVQELFFENNKLSEIKDRLINRNALKNWINAYFPHMTTSLSKFLTLVLFPFSRTDIPQTHLNSGDSQLGKLESKFPIGATSTTYFDYELLLSSYTSPVLFALSSCSIPIKFHGLHRLFTTFEDGRSFHKLENSIVGYNGPTLILIRASTTVPSTTSSLKSVEYTFGAYASSPWKKQKNPEFFGNDQCLLFQLFPYVKIAGVKETPMNQKKVGGRFQYFHSSSLGGGPKFAQGIGIGGSTTQPRMFLSESLDYCNFSATDITFQPLQLIPPHTPGSIIKFTVESVEIWGVGDDGAYKSLGQHREIASSNIQKARSVDKAAFLGDFRSGLFESKLFDYRKQLRDECILVDCEEESRD